MAVATRVLLSLLIAVAVAAVVLWATRFHVFFFPFILVLGAPLYWIWNPRQRSSR